MKTKKVYQGREVISASKHSQICGNTNLVYDGTKLLSDEDFRCLWSCPFCGRYVLSRKKRGGRR